jgi:hypothetical protein
VYLLSHSGLDVGMLAQQVVEESRPPLLGADDKKVGQGTLFCFLSYLRVLLIRWGVRGENLRP